MKKPIEIDNKKTKNHVDIFVENEKKNEEIRTETEKETI